MPPPSCLPPLPTLRLESSVLVEDLARDLIGSTQEQEWRGGETAGLARLAAYFGPKCGYHKTRNQLGTTASSRLSPWLAHGCLSPRTVHAHAKAAAPRDAFFKFYFEMCWRDYFRFYCAHNGSSVFFAGGPAQKQIQWRRCAEQEAAWREGRTGVLLVDAIMTELRSTGFTNNRSRYWNIREPFIEHSRTFHRTF